MELEDKPSIKKSMPFKLKIATPSQRKSRRKNTPVKLELSSDTEIENDEIILDELENSSDCGEEINNNNNKENEKEVIEPKETKESLNLKKKPARASKGKGKAPKCDPDSVKIVQKELSELEKLHRHNIADNKAMLARLMQDLKHMAPIPSLKPKPAKKPKERKSDGLVARRNPERKRRYAPYDPPVTRARRATLPGSSAELSSLQDAESPRHKVPEFEEEDDAPVPAPRPRKSSPTEREIKSADEITEEDLEMVADHVRMKRYDSVYGSTCHQCRQKTIDQKTICRDEDCFGVRGQFCGPCLRNRYGEDVRTALKDPDWTCPPCRGICNCSFCRRKSGRSSTGILIHLAKEHGYDNVNDYLQSLKKGKTEEEEMSE